MESCGAWEGDFPKHKIPLNELDVSGTIICSDGSVKSLSDYGKKPHAIIGDFDSISKKLKEDFKDILIYRPDQSENDLQKSLQWIKECGGKSVTILGASGKREDHFLGNIFLILQLNTTMNIKMITDYGRFHVVKKSNLFNGYRGQKVSLFSIDKSIRITTKGLQYPLQDQPLNTLYRGTLNTMIDDQFSVNISHGQILVYCAF